MLINSRVVIASALALFTLAGCAPKDSDKSPTSTASKDEIAATVNGYPITVKQVNVLLNHQTDMQRRPESRKIIIDGLATQLLAEQEALKEGLNKNADVMEQLEIAKTSVLTQAFIQDFMKNNVVTDAQLNAEYQNLKAKSDTTQYKAHHILVKTADEAKTIIGKLNKNPASFEAIAKAQSIDPGSKVKGGDLGWFDPKSMVPEFSAALAKLEKGKFTEEPVKTEFGYHVILQDDTRLSATDFPTLEQIKPGLTQQLKKQNLKKLLDQMKAAAKIELVATAPSTPHNAAGEAIKK